jgi:hypothetical protein
MAQTPPKRQSVQPTANELRLQRQNDSLSDLITRYKEAFSAMTTAPPLEGDAHLKGLHRFKVFVDVPSPLADTSGLRIRSELKLRQNGISVGDSLTDAFFNVDCVVLQPTGPTVDNLVVYSCYVYVDMYLVRQQPTRNRVLGVVWRSRSGVSMVGRNGFHDSLVSDVDAAMDEFLNAWYKANPKSG